MFIDRSPAVLEPLPARYHVHFDALLAALEGDDRVRAVWLSGSLARGSADAASDLDLILAVADDGFDEFVDGWSRWLQKVAPMLIAKEIPGSRLIAYAMTEDFCRIDVVIEAVGHLPESPHRRRTVVLDRDDLDADVPPARVGPGPNAERITAIITEFWRQQAIFPMMLDVRRDLLSALLGVQQAWQMLYDVFVESNQPLPPTGVKLVSAKLNSEQLAIMLRLPPAGADRELLVAADAAIRAAMDTAGRAAAVRVGADYPEHLAEVVNLELERHSL